MQPPWQLYIVSHLFQCFLAAPDGQLRPYKQVSVQALECRLGHKGLQRDLTSVLNPSYSLLLKCSLHGN